MASPAGTGDAEETLVPLLRDLLRIWASRVSAVPRIGASDNPDADLLGVLGMDASAREVRARPMLGPQLRTHLFTALNISATRWQTELARIAERAMERIGHAEWNPRISSMTFADRAHFRTGAVRRAGAVVRVGAAATVQLHQLDSDRDTRAAA